MDNRILNIGVILFLVVFIVSCKKEATVVSNVPTYGNSNLWAIKAGNIWIYQDSIYNSGNTLKSAFTDTVYMTNKTTTSPDASGITFYGLNDSLGWFGRNAYIATPSDQYGGYILVIDSLGRSPYYFFLTASYDYQTLLSSKIAIDSTCTGTDRQYGFITPTTINGYSCIKNIEIISDCSLNVVEKIITYVSSGVGLVRIENYKKVPNKNNGSIYLSFSQTLKKFLPK